MTLEKQFRSRVSVFLECSGMSPTAFGMKALGDPNFMRQIGRGRSPSLRTADRILAWIAEQDGASGGGRDPPRRRRHRKPTTGKEQRGEADDDGEPEE